jgi:hypothetical protein
VTNTGAVPSGTIATSLGGADAGQFAKSADTCNGQTLAPGQSCTLSGAFAPTSVGGKAASLGATATPGGTASASLSGTGAQPAHLQNMSPVGPYGTVVITTPPSGPSQSFLIQNTGGVPTGTISTALTGADTNQFNKAADNCNGNTLAPGANCTVVVLFEPTSSGPKTASLDLSATPGGSVSIPLSGTGQTPANLTLTPAPFDFGNVLRGTSSPAQTFTITNTGEQSTGNLTVALFTNLPPLRFGGPNPCGTAPLAGGASCSVQVTFAPQAGDTGSFGADLSVSASPGGTASSSLSGTAVTTPANLQISITSESATTPGPYGSSDSRNLGTGISAGTFTRSKVWIKNTGAADASVPASSIPFSTTGGSFQAIAPVSTCNVADEPQIRFTNPVIVGGAECYVVVTGGPNVSNQPFSTSFTITGTPGGSITGTISGN